VFIVISNSAGTQSKCTKTCPVSVSSSSFQQVFAKKLKCLFDSGEYLRPVRSELFVSLPAVVTYEAVLCTKSIILLGARLGYRL
jgi:hypothetical protein